MRAGAAGYSHFDGNQLQRLASGSTARRLLRDHARHPHGLRDVNAQHRTQDRWHAASPGGNCGDGAAHGRGRLCEQRHFGDVRPGHELKEGSKAAEGAGIGGGIGIGAGAGGATAP